MTIAVLKNKFIVLFIVILGTLSFPIATPPEQHLATAEGDAHRYFDEVCSRTDIQTCRGRLHAGSGEITLKAFGFESRSRTQLRTARSDESATDIVCSLADPGR